jgi:hypothetical protein
LEASTNAAAPIEKLLDPRSLRSQSPHPLWLSKASILSPSPTKQWTLGEVRALREDSAVPNDGRSPQPFRGDLVGSANDAELEVDAQDTQLRADVGYRLSQPGRDVRRERRNEHAEIDVHHRRGLPGEASAGTTEDREIIEHSLSDAF